MPTFDLKCGARFYHPPKCGGGWVYQAALAADIVESTVQPKHIGPHDAPAELGFTTVRHPLTWWRSVYSNRLKWWSKDLRDLAGKDLAYYPVIDKCKADDFPEFMRNVLNAGIVNDWWGGQYDHPCIQHVMRQESLIADFLDVLRKVGQDYNPTAIWNVPFVNLGSYGKEKRWQLSDRLRDRVMDAVDKDLLARFGYL